VQSVPGVSRASRDCRAPRDCRVRQGEPLPLCVSRIWSARSSSRRMQPRWRTTELLARLVRRSSAATFGRCRRTACTRWAPATRTTHRTAVLGSSNWRMAARSRRPQGPPAGRPPPPRPPPPPPAPAPAGGPNPLVLPHGPWCQPAARPARGTSNAFRSEPATTGGPTPHHLFGPEGVGRGAAETHALLPVLRRDLRRGSLIMNNRCMPKAFKHTEALPRAARLLGPVPRQGSTLADLHSAHPGQVNLRTARRRLHDLSRASLSPPRAATCSYRSG